jgi:N-glycosylase/DNA lyase
LLSGHSFRWKNDDGKFTGVIGSNVVELKKKGDFIISDVVFGDISESEIKKYLGLNVDYERILSSSSNDKYVSQAVKDYPGYYILGQDPYEVLITFICSTNSSVHNTRLKVANLSRLFGKRISGDYYTFPGPGKLAGLNEEEIMKAKVGYRGKYIIGTAQKLMEDDLLENLSELDDASAVEKLVDFPGVGRKVADCLLLFGYNRFNRIPLDVWMKRILVSLYGADPKMKYEEMEKFGEKKLGKYAGYVSHFLFELAREGMLPI